MGTPEDMRMCYCTEKIFPEKKNVYLFEIHVDNLIRTSPRIEGKTRESWAIDPINLIFFTDVQI